MSAVVTRTQVFNELKVSFFILNWKCSVLEEVERLVKCSVFDQKQTHTNR